MPEKKISALCSTIDTIVHLAALNEIDSAHHPKKAIDVNIWETVKLHEIAIKMHVRNFIYLSTAHVYKAPLVGSFDENSCCEPAHPYSITHKAAEDFILAKRSHNAINSTLVRLSNSFGYPAFDTSDRWTLLVNDICKQAITNKKIVLKGNGKQIRNFICLEDVCESIAKLMEISKVDLGNGIVNLGSDKNLQILDMAKKVKERFDLKYSTDIEIVINEADNSKPEHLDFKIEKIKKLNISLAGHINKEIDGLLDFCEKKYLKND